MQALYHASTVPCIALALGGTLALALGASTVPCIAAY